MANASLRYATISARPLPRSRGRAREGAVSDTVRSPAWRVSDKQRMRARALRRVSTEAEQIVWNALCAHRLYGASFRRQTPIGPYVADFVCQAARIVVEIDGGQHFEPEQERRDERRDRFLASKGFRILRFNNHDVMKNRSGVIETIALALESAPSPTLPRKRGRDEAAVRVQASARRESEP